MRLEGYHLSNLKSDEYTEKQNWVHQIHHLRRIQTIQESECYKTIGMLSLFRSGTQ